MDAREQKVDLRSTRAVWEPHTDHCVGCPDCMAESDEMPRVDECGVCAVPDYARIYW